MSIVDKYKIQSVKNELFELYKTYYNLNSSKIIPDIIEQIENEELSKHIILDILSSIKKSIENELQQLRLTVRYNLLDEDEKLSYYMSHLFTNILREELERRDQFLENNSVEILQAKNEIEHITTELIFKLSKIMTDT